MCRESLVMSSVWPSHGVALWVLGGERDGKGGSQVVEVRINGPGHTKSGRKSKPMD
jgi:hypothetical protein